MILDPVLNMLPGFKSFQVPAHTGTCPTASFSVFGNTYTVSEHCVLLEQYRTPITGAFSLMFLLASVFIVLMA
ncbi:hypothetical protein DIE23_14060 [Burkholderia sp. Bp9143]|nr:hypothetical protein DIE23_14060 [Burkholderia sp. Bp9143]